jgi:hypothetical protein
MQTKNKKPKFVENESYKHKLAKELLLKWLRDQDEKKDFCRVAQFEWRSNYGIFCELPFYETSHPHYFEESGGLIKPWDYNFAKKSYKKNNYDFLFDNNFNKGAILFKPDISLTHKGGVTKLFEIKNTHEVTSDKLLRIIKFFRRYHIEVYEIEAEEILRHCNVPEYIKCDLLYKTY